LLDVVCKALEEEGVETEIVYLADGRVNGCVACYRCFQKKDGRCAMEEDPLNLYVEKMRTADGILMASPTYFADLTPELKALIDRAGLVARANDNFLKRKVGAAVIAVRRAGAVHAFDSINHFFLLEEMIVPGSIYWNLGIGRDKGDVDQDEEGLRTMTQLGKNMAWLLKRLS